MQTDITQQWQKPINTKHLRESPAAYNTFKIYCQNPQWTLKDLAKNTNQKQNTVNEWSSKYHYISRRQAYYQHSHEELDPYIIATKRKHLLGQLHREDKDQQILDDDQLETILLQQEILTKTQNQQKLTREEHQQYITQKDSYFKNSKDHTNTIHELNKFIDEGVNPDDIDTQQLGNGAAMLVEQIRQARKKGENK